MRTRLLWLVLPATLVLACVVPNALAYSPAGVNATGSKVARPCDFNAVLAINPDKPRGKRTLVRGKTALFQVRILNQCSRAIRLDVYPRPEMPLSIFWRGARLQGNPPLVHRTIQAGKLSLINFKLVIPKNAGRTFRMEIAIAGRSKNVGDQSVTFARVKPVYGNPSASPPTGGTQGKYKASVPVTLPGAAPVTAVVDCPQPALRPREIDTQVGVGSWTEIVTAYSNKSQKDAQNKAEAAAAKPELQEQVQQKANAEAANDPDAASKAREAALGKCEPADVCEEIHVFKVKRDSSGQLIADWDAICHINHSGSSPAYGITCTSTGDRTAWVGEAGAGQPIFEAGQPEHGTCYFVASTFYGGRASAQFDW